MNNLLNQKKNKRSDMSVVKQIKIGATQ